MRSKSAAARSARDAWLLRPALAFLMALAVAAVVGLLKNRSTRGPRYRRQLHLGYLAVRRRRAAPRVLEGASNPKTRKRS